MHIACLLDIYYEKYLQNNHRIGSVVSRNYNLYASQHAFSTVFSDGNFIPVRIFSAGKRL